MDTHGHSLGERPSTRHVRYKKVLLVDHHEGWGEPILDVLTDRGYKVVVASGAGAAANAMDRGPVDLVVVCAMVGEEMMTKLLEYLQGEACPPPVLLVAALHGDHRWEAWRQLPCTAVLRPPYTMADVVEAVKALVGSPWQDLMDGE
jgi:DNA-binding response OmpR family regulator